jgi:hypothetical protein
LEILTLTLCEEITVEAYDVFEFCEDAEVVLAEPELFASVLLLSDESVSER